MRTPPSYIAKREQEISVGIRDLLRDTLGMNISFDRYGTDSTNLVRASAPEFSVAYSPEFGVAYILSVTLRK